MEKEKKTVKIKLIRHEWPDEKEARLRKRRKIIASIVACALLFTSGIGVGTLIAGNGSAKKDKLSTLYRVMSELWYFRNEEENLEEKLNDGAMKGLVNAAGDIHTRYFTKEEADSFVSSLSGDLVGIGVQYNSTLRIISKVFDQSPAQKAGIQPGDEIVAVDGQRVTSETDLPSIITGKEGTSVVITVNRDGKEITLPCVREYVETSVSHKMDDTVGIVSLMTFGETTGKAFGEALHQLKDKGATDLIIDLRNNGGGYVTSALEVASYLLPQDSIVLQEKKSDGTIRQNKTIRTIQPVSFDSITVLINGETASAAEVLTSSLKELMNATVVGTLSYGKGTVQTSIPFKDGSMVKYTSAEWLTSKGNAINGVGITPDIEIEDTFGLRYLDPQNFENVKVDQVSVYASIVQGYLKTLGYEIDREDGYFSITSYALYQQYLKDYGRAYKEEVDVEEYQFLFKEAMKKAYRSEEKDVQLQAALEVSRGRAIV